MEEVNTVAPATESAPAPAAPAKKPYKRISKKNN